MGSVSNLFLVSVKYTPTKDIQILWQSIYHPRTYICAYVNLIGGLLCCNSVKEYAKNIPVQLQTNVNYYRKDLHQTVNVQISDTNMNTIILYGEKDQWKFEGDTLGKEYRLFVRKNTPFYINEREKQQKIIVKRH